MISPKGGAGLGKPEGGTGGARCFDRRRSGRAKVLSPVFFARRQRRERMKGLPRRGYGA